MTFVRKITLKSPHLLATYNVPPIAIRTVELRLISVSQVSWAAVPGAALKTKQNKNIQFRRLTRTRLKPSKESIRLDLVKWSWKIYSRYWFSTSVQWIFKYQDIYNDLLRSPNIWIKILDKMGRCKIGLTFDLIIEFLIKLIPGVSRCGGVTYCHFSAINIWRLRREF